MRFRLRPVESSFYELFQEAGQHLVTGARLLGEAINGGPDLPDVAHRLREAEQAADETTRAIIQQANSTFVTPFDREDIYDLAAGLNDVIDLMEETVDLIVLYGVTVLPAEIPALVGVLQQCADITAQAMPRLKTMQGLHDYWTEVNRLENEADQLYRRTLARLFGGEYDAMEVLKLKDILSSLEGAIDACEDVANTVEQIAVKES